MKTIRDNRGIFFLDDKVDYDQVFIATNEARYTFRGMHFQSNPYQVKHLTVIQGRIVDFLYNLKTGEVKEYDLGKGDGIPITEEYAHGYLTVAPDTIVYYGVIGKFNPNTYKSIVWDTIPEIKTRIEEITGNCNRIVISNKDRIGK
jgi:dTDP-4-dehydrorhamnose 3,5-epimerase-like enzyme